MSITSLISYRARKRAAMSYHPCIWTPRDAVDTANAFHAELAGAERGTAVEAHPERAGARIFSMGRYRKARAMDALAVALLLALMAALGVVGYAASAKADTDTGMRALAWEVGPEVCAWLDEHPSIAGVMSAGQAIASQGYTAEEAGEVIAYAAFDICQRHIPLLRQFVATFGPRQVA